MTVCPRRGNTALRFGDHWRRREREKDVRSEGVWDGGHRVRGSEGVGADCVSYFAGEEEEGNGGEVMGWAELVGDFGGRDGRGSLFTRILASRIEAEKEVSGRWW